MTAKNKFKINNVVPKVLAGVPDVDLPVEAFLASLLPLAILQLLDVACESINA